ncbi:MAG: hypothetical protein AB7G93_19470 [Bdellovibrionales bacterium]
MSCLFISPRAQGGFSFQTFRNWNSPDFVFLDSARDRVAAEASPILNSGIYHYWSNPVAFDQQEDGSGSLVKGIHSIHIAGEYSAWKSASLGLEIPIYQLNYHKRGEIFALGDLRAFSHMELSGNLFNAGIKLVATPSLYAPTGNPSYHLSNPNGGAGIGLGAEKRLGSFLVVANAGIDHFPGASFGNVNYHSQIFGGLGIRRAISSKWTVQFETFGRLIHDLRTGDIYAGGRYQMSSERDLFFGASLASTDFDGSPIYRILFGLLWTPSTTKVITRRVHTKVETVQKIQTIYDCGPKVYSGRFRGRELSVDEKRDFKTRKPLPYSSTASHRLSTLRLGGKNAITTAGVPYIKNAQVLFAVDLPDLPTRASIISIRALELVIDVNKWWNPAKEKADMICLVEEKICSGDIIDQQKYAESVNFKFFAGKEPPNDFFARQISAATKTESGGVSLSRVKLALPLERLIENSTYPDKLNLIYPEQDSRTTADYKTLYFAVANDIYVYKDVVLNVELNVQVCSESRPKPTTETFEEESKVFEEELPGE